MNTDTVVALRQLWKASFGDSDAYLDSFFSTAFCPDRCHFLEMDGIPVSALYWLPCSLEGQPMAYLYAITTARQQRGQGLCRQLMAETHEILKRQGYAGVILVPAEPILFDLYRKFGYRTFCTCREFSVQAETAGVVLRRITSGEYARLRAKFLPHGGVLQDGVTLRFLQEHTYFYTGDGVLLSASVDDSSVLCGELLGDTAAAPGIVQALGCVSGRFRIPGAGRDFAMYLPLREDCPVPRWFGLALD